MKKILLSLQIFLILSVFFFFQLPTFNKADAICVETGTALGGTLSRTCYCYEAQTTRTLYSVDLGRVWTNPTGSCAEIPDFPSSTDTGYQRCTEDSTYNNPLRPKNKCNCPHAGAIFVERSQNCEYAENQNVQAFCNQNNGAQCALGEDNGVCGYSGPNTCSPLGVTAARTAPPSTRSSGSPSGGSSEGSSGGSNPSTNTQEGPADGSMTFAQRGCTNHKSCRSNLYCQNDGIEGVCACGGPGQHWDPDAPNRTDGTGKGSCVCDDTSKIVDIIANAGKSQCIDPPATPAGTGANGSSGGGSGGSSTASKGGGSTGGSGSASSGGVSVPPPTDPSNPFGAVRSDSCTETGNGFTGLEAIEQGVCHAVCVVDGVTMVGPDIRDASKCGAPPPATSGGTRPANAFRCSPQDSGKEDAVGTPIEVRSVPLPNNSICKGTTYRQYDSCEVSSSSPDGNCDIFWCVAGTPTDPISCNLPDGRPNPDENPDPMTPGKSIESCTPEKVGQQIAIVGGKCSDLNPQTDGVYYKYCTCTATGLDRSNCTNDDPIDRTCITKNRPASSTPSGGATFCQKPNNQNIGKQVPGSTNCTARCNDGTLECKGNQYCIFSPDNKHYVSDCQCEFDPTGKNRCAGVKTGPALASRPSTTPNPNASPTPTPVGNTITVHVVEQQRGRTVDKEGIRVIANKVNSKEEKSDSTNRRGIAILSGLTTDAYDIDLDLSSYRSSSNLPVRVTLSPTNKNPQITITIVSTLSPTPSSDGSYIGPGGERLYPTLREDGSIHRPDGGIIYPTTRPDGGRIGPDGRVFFPSSTPRPSSTPALTATPRPTNPASPSATVRPTVAVSMFTISGTVYVDTNRNGVKENDEHGLGNATVELQGKNKSTVTNTSGGFSFPNITPGDYVVNLQVPNGFTTTTTNPVRISATSNTTVNFGVVSTAGTTITPGASLSPSAIPTVSITPSVTPTPANTRFSLDTSLLGIGRNGNNNPLNRQRSVTALVFNTNNQKALEKSVDLTFDTQSGTFKGILDSGNALSSGSHLIKLKLRYYLTRLIPGFQSISQGQLNVLPQVVLFPGDFTEDNIINGRDYNILFSCLGNKANTAECGDWKARTDINDDGVVNGEDYSLFLESQKIQNGD